MTEVTDDEPLVFREYLRAWQSGDEAVIRPAIEASLSEDVIWCDPVHDVVGRDAVVAMIVDFHAGMPGAVLARASAFDAHHGRYRYAWTIHVGDELFLEGLDVSTLDDDGLIERIDGFFGPLTAEVPP